MLPSRREGFGVALIEAMATGLPAVATRSGGPESIVRREDGVLVMPDAAAALASGIADAASRLGGFDRHAIAEGVRARFGRAAVGGMLVSLYRRVLEDGKST